MSLFLASRSAVAVAFASFASFAFCAVGCSSSTDSTPAGSSGSSGSSGSTIASADVCASRCEAKFTKCGGSADTAKTGCAAQVCNASPTADQLTCLEGKSCDDIASATSFASLCPASTTNPNPTPTPAAATCGSATCTMGQYCALSYDSSAMAWKPSACKAVPSACTSKGASELCTCMKDNTGCPTSGLVSTKCSQADGALQFGCQ